MMEHFKSPPKTLLKGLLLTQLLCARQVTMEMRLTGPPGQNRVRVRREPVTKRKPNWSTTPATRRWTTTGTWPQWRPLLPWNPSSPTGQKDIREHGGKKKRCRSRFWNIYFFVSSETTSTCRISRESRASTSRAGGKTREGGCTTPTL